MSRTGKIILGGFVVAILVGGTYVIVEASKFKDNVTNQVNGVTIDIDSTVASNFQTIYFLLDIDIFNPVALPIWMVNIVADITIDGNYIGTAASQTFTVPAKSITNFVLPVAINTNDVAEEIISLIGNISGTHTIQVTGNVKTLLGSSPINKSISVTL